MSIDYRIAVIGAGNLGSALITGLLRAQAIAPERLLAVVGTPEHAAKLSQILPIKVTAGNSAEVAFRSDVIIVAVKPEKVHAVLEEIQGSLRPDQIVVSLAASVSIALLESWLSRPIPVLRALPNLAMRVCQSATVLSVGTHVTSNHRKIGEKIFKVVGTTLFVEDAAIHGVTALAGSGPGFIYWMMEAFTAGGIAAGLSPEVASSLTTQTFLGASQLVQETRVDPTVLRAQITTSKGTTATGIVELENRGMKDAFIAVIVAAAERSLELGRALTDPRSARA